MTAASASRSLLWFCIIVIVYFSENRWGLWRAAAIDVPFNMFIVDKHISKWASHWCFIKSLNISQNDLFPCILNLTIKAYTLPHTDKTDIVCWNNSSVTDNERVMTQIHVVCLAGYQNEMNDCYANATEPQCD